jgi:hypothetical protein
MEKSRDTAYFLDTESDCQNEDKKGLASCLILTSPFMDCSKYLAGGVQFL